MDGDLLPGLLSGLVELARRMEAMPNQTLEAQVSPPLGADEPAGFRAGADGDA